LIHFYKREMSTQGSSAGVGAGVDLKDSEEVADYIENLGIEYRFGCYHEKDPKACHLLGDYLESIKKDFTKSLKIYTSNCDDYGYGHSCHKVAGYKYFGKSCTKDADQAYDYFKKGCDHDYYSSCLSAGLLDAAKESDKDYSRSVPPNATNSLNFYKKACDEGNLAEACHRYSAFFIRGMKNVCQKNMEEAFKYSLKACELGNMGGCVNVSVMYSKGDGVEKNPVAAKEYGEIAREMMNQLKEQQRIAFQEGAEQ